MASLMFFGSIRLTDIAWRGHVVFKVLVPRLYALETMKNIDVASKLSHGGLEFSFRRNPRGGVEQAQLELLKEKIEGCILSNMNDRWAWSLEGSGEFSVSSVRKVIDATLLPKGTTKSRWIKAVPIKINVHAWKVKHDCLPTRINISHRGMEIEFMLRHMCDNAVESSRHLFFSCHFISELMHKITRWWDMDYMEINSFEEWLEWVSSIQLPLKQKQIFEAFSLRRSTLQEKRERAMNLSPATYVAGDTPSYVALVQHDFLVKVGK
nr:RNA-directed DNA polymerase, eukaryota, reverse transcriptase zinc-binding domain protein [Tanacetum cinerariifolium]